MGFTNLDPSSNLPWHYHDVIMSAMAFIQAQINESIKDPRYWPLCGEFNDDQWLPPHKRPGTQKMFPFDDVIMDPGMLPAVDRLFLHVCEYVCNGWPSLTRVRPHYNDIIMSAMESQITSLTIVYSAVSSVADQRKHQSSVSLAFVWGIHRWPVNSPHKGPVTRKMFPFDDVIMITCMALLINVQNFLKRMKFCGRNLQMHSLEIILYSIIFHETLFLWVDLMITSVSGNTCHRRGRNHYLRKWWPRLQTQMEFSRPRGVN